MTELTTRKGTDVANDVKRLFGDQDGVQVTDADILQWINTAQRKIVATNPILQRTIVKDTVSGLGTYAYPADRIQFIQSISYDNVPLEGLSYTEAQEYILKNKGGGSVSGDPTIWWQWAQSINYWPVPDKTVAGALKLDFVAIPEDLVQLSDLLSLPDRYYDAMVEQVMVKAHILDENYDAANFSKSMFTEGLASLSEQENRMRLSQYPSITLREEDAW